MVLTTHLLLPACKWIGAIPPPPLSACTDMSWLTFTFTTVSGAWIISGQFSSFVYRTEIWIAILALGKENISYSTSITDDWTLQTSPRELSVWQSAIHVTYYTIYGTCISVFHSCLFWLLVWKFRLWRRLPTHGGA